MNYTLNISDPQLLKFVAYGAILGLEGWTDIKAIFANIVFCRSCRDSSAALNKVVYRRN
jgi:hypothetical protein